MNDDIFEVVTWPEIQELMDKEGFQDNSCLINDEPLFSEYGSYAYFVRQTWLKEKDPYFGISDKELREIFEDIQADEEIDRQKSEGYV